MERRWLFGVDLFLGLPTLLTGTSSHERAKEARAVAARF
jgi:hypothetical protein